MWWCGGQTYSLDIRLKGGELSISMLSPSCCTIKVGVFRERGKQHGAGLNQINLIGIAESNKSVDEKDENLRHQNSYFLCC